MKKKSRTVKIRASAKTDFIFLLPAGFLLIAWPLFVRRLTVRTYLEQYPWFPDLQTTADYFLVVRGRALLILAGMMLLFLIAGLFLKKWTPGELFTKEGAPVMIGFGVFMAGILVSGLCSRYPQTVLSGMSEQYESLPVLMAYAVIFIYTAAVSKGEREKEVLIRCLMTGAALQVIIGLLQLSGHDFWSSAVGRTLIGESGKALEQTEYIFSGSSGNSVYMSFYHPNYAAVYIMVLLPVCTGKLAAAARRITGKNTGTADVPRTQETVTEAEKAAEDISLLFYSLLLPGLLICLWGTGSKTAMLVLCFSAVLFVIWFLAARMKKWIPAIALTALMIILACTGAVLLRGRMSGLLRRFLGEQTVSAMQEIIPGEDGIRVVWKGTPVLLSMDREGEGIVFSISGEDGRPLPLKYDGTDQRYFLPDQNFEGLSFDAFTDNGAWWIIMYQGEVPWYFVKDKDAVSWQYITLYRKPDIIANAPHMPTFGYDNALSGRLYIWSRTVPLLKDRILIGSGADTFALMFPQNDYIARANIGLEMLMPVISRAHSLYLQTALQTGIIPAFGLFAGVFAILSGFGRRRKQHPLLETAVRWSIVLWLLMGITNDSVIPVTPIVCMLLGLC